MNSGSIVAAVALGLSALAYALPANAAGSDGNSSNAGQTRGQQRPAASTPRQSRQQPGAGWSQADVGASSTATSASEGGVGVGSQGQSLTVDNHGKAAASTAIAAPLTSSNDTCMGSASLGATGMAFGLSLGTTYTDENCMMLKNSRELWNMGFRGAAIARMCMDQRNRQALEASGVTCPATASNTASSTAAPPPTVSSSDRTGGEQTLADRTVGERTAVERKVVADRPAAERTTVADRSVSERPANEREKERREKSVRDAISPSAQSERFGRW